jgi:ATP phosphoribosyltransferase
MINIALPKGRLGEKVYNLLSKIGYNCQDFDLNSRKLVFKDEKNNVCYFWVKPADVAIYVELGAADVGVVGKDIIDEYSPDVYELADLGLGKCSMCVAAKDGWYDDHSIPLRVATKFVNTTKKYYGEMGRDIQIIKLNGSIELAPILDISDVIVDIVETGTTLKENNLKVYETISKISARLIANKTAFKFKRDDILALNDKLKGVIENDKTD